jgi:hypothetical protein
VPGERGADLGAEATPFFRRHRLHKALRVAAKAKQGLRAPLDLDSSQARDLWRSCVASKTQTENASIIIHAPSTVKWTGTRGLAKIVRGFHG